MLSSVVVAAEELEVVEAGGASELPGDDVVDVAPLRRPVAAGVLAVPVPVDDCFAEGGGDDPGSASDVDDLPGWSEHDSGDGGVAAEPVDHGLAEQGPIDGFGGFEVAVLEVDDHVEMWRLAPLLRYVASVQGVAGKVVEPIGSPLRR